MLPEEQRVERKKRRAVVGRKLALFPLVYVLVVLPVTVDGVLKNSDIVIPELAIMATFLYR